MKVLSRLLVVQFESGNGAVLPPLWLILEPTSLSSVHVHDLFVDLERVLPAEHLLHGLSLAARADADSGLRENYQILVQPLVHDSRFSAWESLRWTINVQDA
jgi:hypothetical protein